MWRRLRPLFYRGRAEQDLDAELRFDIEQRLAVLLAAGMTESEARRQVRLEFGGLEQTKEECREVRAIAVLESLAQDVRLAARALRRTPLFTAAAVLSLTLGFGANAAIFSLLDQLLVRSLAVRQPEQLVLFRSFGPNPGMDRNSGRKMSFSFAKYKEFRDKAQCFSGVVGRYADAASLSYAGQTDRVTAELVTGNYFEVLGVGAAAGRLFTPDDDRTWRGEPWIVLSHEYWMRRFGGDRRIIGQAVRVNNTMMTVIGVSAAEFHGIQRGVGFDIRLPMMMKPVITP